MGTGTGQRHSHAVAVFLLSASAFTLQFLLTRIFSVLLWHHFVYFVVTLSLLGWTVGGSFFGVLETKAKTTSPGFRGLCAGGFAVSSVLSIWLVCQASNRGWLDIVSGNSTLAFSLVYFVVMVPFVFTGLFLLALFREDPAHAGKTYFINLLGSGAGCLVFVFFITPLGAQGLLLWTIFLPSALFCVVHLKALPPLRLTSIVLVLLICAFLAHQMPIEPNRAKQYWSSLPEEGRRVEFTEWNPISRIDVLSLGGPRKMMTIDGDAQAPIFPLSTVGSPIDDTPHRFTAYQFLDEVPPARALVIGTGGGADLLVARHFQAKKIVGVDVNPSSVRVLRSEYEPWFQAAEKNGSFELHLEDGRSFIERSRDRYDLIMMYGVDSLAALNTGAYVLAENYLYTQEAFEKYWDHLSSRGVMQISRWCYPSAPREELRAFVLAYHALEKRGVEDPASHLFVVVDGSGTPSADLIISKPIVSQASGKRLSAFLGVTGLSLAFPQPDEDVKKVGENAFMAYVRYAREGRADEFFALYPFQVTPVHDDNPFFFQYGRWSHLFTGYPMGPSYYEYLNGSWPMKILTLFFVHCALLSVLLLARPVWNARHCGARWMARTTVHFASLGYGFIFVEMYFIQRLVLVLGHPIYSMAVVLPGLLLSAAVGSLLSRRLDSGTRLVGTALTGVLGIAIAMATHFAPDLLERLVLIPSAARIGVALICLFPFGCLMGIPFPTAIREYSQKPALLPLAWTVNGVTSVMGSMLAVVAAQLWGFSRVGLIGAGFYFVATICSAWFVEFHWNWKRSWKTESLAQPAT